MRLSGGARALLDRFNLSEPWQIAYVDHPLTAILAIDEVLDTGALEPAGQGVGLESGGLAYRAKPDQVLGIHRSLRG